MNETKDKHKYLKDDEALALSYRSFFISSPLYTDLVIVVGWGAIINAFIDSIKNEELLERDLQADKWRKSKENEGRDYDSFKVFFSYINFFCCCNINKRNSAICCLVRARTFNKTKK